MACDGVVQAVVSDSHSTARTDTALVVTAWTRSSLNSLSSQVSCNTVPILLPSAQLETFTWLPVLLHRHARARAHTHAHARTRTHTHTHRDKTRVIVVCNWISWPNQHPVYCTMSHQDQTILQLQRLWWKRKQRHKLGRQSRRRATTVSYTRLHLAHLATLTTMKHALALQLDPHGIALLVRSWPIESRKGCEVFDTFATHASLSYDVTDTDSWAQNGSVHSRFFATLKCRYFAEDEISSKKKVFSLIDG